MAWHPATPPITPPAEPLEAVWIDGARITPVRVGEMRLADREWRWLTGAVYDDAGHLVPQSQAVRTGGGLRAAPRTPIPVDPLQIPLTKPRDELDGSWVFVGHWHAAFGHFLIETLPNLWPAEAAAADGLLGIRPYSRLTPVVGGRGLVQLPGGHPFRDELVELAGFGDRPVMMSRHQLTRVERLLVPERPVVLTGWVRPEAVQVWRRVAEAVDGPSGSRKVLLSRSRYNASQPYSGLGSDLGSRRTDPDWDRRLDRSFAAAGFDVVHPEELSIREQIAVVRGAEVIAASSGTALHLSCFAAPGTKVLEIGDLRTRDKRFPTQQAIDAACGHQVDVLPYGDYTALDRLELLDGEGLPRSGETKGVLTGRPRLRRLLRRTPGHDR